MAHFVQFMHPGSEPDNVPDDGKPWNQGIHRRSFLQCPGQALTAAERVVRGDLVFWGEWESAAKVQPLKGKKRGQPSRLFIPISAPCPDEGTPQNTDPFVFGDEFLYCCCRQTRSNGKRTYLSELCRGDVILFGSNFGDQFVLDTVFVIASHEDYHPGECVKNLGGKVPAQFVESTLKPLAQAFHGRRSTTSDGPVCTEKDWNKEDEVCCAGWMPCGIDGDIPQFRLYRGATVNNRVAEMFSFVPASTLLNSADGFVRPSVKEKFMKKNVPAFRECFPNGDLRDHFGAWDKVRRAVLEQKLLLGVQFDLPEKLAQV